MWRSHGEHGRDACCNRVLGDPGLRAIINSGKAPRTIFGLSKRRSMRLWRRIAMLELTPSVKDRRFEQGMIMQIETLAVETLRPYERNARTHSKKQIRQIAKSIERFWLL